VLRRFMFLVAGAAIVLVLSSGAAATSLPTGFNDSLVVAAPAPTALAFTPDGRLLIATQPGALRVFTGGALLPQPALDLSAKLCSNSERGLLGVAVDPNFASNHFIYVYYTFKKFTGCPTNASDEPVNRVSRFMLADNNVVDPATETVLIDNIPSPGGNHNGGDLQFGKDGFLYVGVGDGGCDYASDSGCAGSNDAARDRNVLVGKVLRITADGGIPSTNPFQGPDSARCNVTGITDPGKVCQETFAWGLRNPFRLAFDPNASETAFYINDVGQNTWEEIDVGLAAADYGWNVREGHCARGSTTDCGAPPAGMTNPIFDYGHADGCASITGGAFVPSGVWPAPYGGSYLFSDYVCGKIFRLVPAGGGTFTRADFATDLGASSAVTLLFGPDGALYYTTYAGGGQVRRIAPSAPSNNAPTAAIAANPTTGVAPLEVAFDGSGSRDPDPGDSLTYIWNFGDGTAVAETTSSSTSHTYTVSGTFRATLTVRDSHGATSAAAETRIEVGTTANTPPVATIVSPSADLLFSVGQALVLRATATDAEDGALPDTALRWTVLVHHNTHTHPYLSPTSGNDVTVAAPAPEDLAATETSHLEVVLDVTDSHGLTTTVRRLVFPHLVDVTFVTDPAGLELGVNDVTVTGPQTVTSWEGYVLAVSARTPQTAGGQSWVFSSWSDAGLRDHAITTPASPAVYTATFVASPANVSAPSVLGIARAGAMLSADGGAWTGSAPLFFEFRWQRCDRAGADCVDIPETTSATYELADADVGSTIRVVVTATNVVGSDSASSEPTERVKHACSGPGCVSAPQAPGG
jgi:glucose/arabinose dehydrogenase/PKD repeat protein